MVKNHGQKSSFLVWISRRREGKVPRVDERAKNARYYRRLVAKRKAAAEDVANAMLSGDSSDLDVRLARYRDLAQQTGVMRPGELPNSTPPRVDGHRESPNTGSSPATPGE